MRIALTYNEKLDAREDHAEFDSLETIETIVAIVESLGHRVTPLEVTGSIPRVIAGLRWIRPDLVLNLAEGERGVFREAFYPALFEQLGYAHTGSSASALALCIDKALAKRVVAAAGVDVPRGELARGAVPAVPLPAIAKPNFEGSSKGITEASLVTTRADLCARVGELLERYPSGVLVEEFVAGLDVSVAWVDGLGAMPAIAYHHDRQIYDYALKHETPERVRIEIPARLDGEVAQRLREAAERVVVALGIAGYGRADFRVTRGGRIVFLEMNALPSLAPRERDLYGAAEQLGKTPGELFAYIIGSAVGMSVSRYSMVGARPTKSV